MIEFLQRSIVASGGKLNVKLRFDGDEFHNEKTMIAADETGVTFSNGQSWECYPWRLIESIWQDAAPKV